MPKLLDATRGEDEQALQEGGRRDTIPHFTTDLEGFQKKGFQWESRQDMVQTFPNKYKRVVPKKAQNSLRRIALGQNFSGNVYELRRKLLRLARPLVEKYLL